MPPCSTPPFLFPFLPLSLPRSLPPSSLPLSPRPSRRATHPDGPFSAPLCPPSCSVTFLRSCSAEIKIPKFISLVFLFACCLNWSRLLSLFVPIPLRAPPDPGPAGSTTTVHGMEEGRAELASRRRAVRCCQLNCDAVWTRVAVGLAAYKR